MFYFVYYDMYSDRPKGRRK